MSTGDIDSTASEYMHAAREELVDIVDVETNTVTGTRRRADMRALNLPHRATYAFIRDSCGYFYVQRRSRLKDYCPLYWDPTPGGVVAAGESYEVTNRREVEEEMGIPTDTAAEHLFTFFYEDSRVRCWCDCWEMTYDGPIKMQVTEVEEVVKMSMQEILERAERGENFTPDSIDACRRYSAARGLPTVSGQPSAVRLL